MLHYLHYLHYLRAYRGGGLELQAYARQFGQVEGRTEVYPVVSLFQGVGEKPFGLLPVKLHR